MTRISTIGLLIIACWIPSLAQSMPNEPLLWLQPISYQEMRDMMDRAKKTMPESDKGGRPESQEMEHSGMDGMQMGDKGEAPSTGRPDRQAMGREGMQGMPGMKEGEGKKPNWRSGMRMRRTYLHYGPFPQTKGRPASSMQGMPMASEAASKTKRMAMGSGAMGMPMGSAMSSVVWLERPDNTIERAMVKQGRSKIQAEYKADDGGWYRLFAYNDLGVKDSTRRKYFSYYTFMSHGEDVEAKMRMPMVRPGYYQDEPELELVELYEEDEQRYRKNVGDTIRVGVLFQGMPLAGSRVTMITERGWSQTLSTDKNGEVSFTLIKEDFPEDGVDRRKSELYLLRVAHKVAVGGQYMGNDYDTTRYIATMPISVSPAKEDWQSQRIAYLVTIITIIGSAVAIAIRRRRRKKA